MKIELKDVIHLYLGCKVKDLYEDEIGILHGVDLSQGNSIGVAHGVIHTRTIDEIKPILRSLSDLKEEEMQMIYNISIGHKFRGGEFKITAKKEINEKTGVFYYWNIKCKQNIYSICIDQYGEVDTYSEDNNNNSTPTSFQSKIFLYLLNQKFDLFGLIESEQAISNLNTITRFYP